MGDKFDYLYVLKALNEIPFNLGKNNLSEFLLGDTDNKSVIKNKLDKMFNFSSLEHLSKEEILEIIESLIINGLVSSTSSQFNKFMKTLSISVKGQDELIKPTLHSLKINGEIENEATPITEEEKKMFEENSEFLESYNDEQKKSIISEKKEILCIAGAGSGKTTVLTKRIEYLTKKKGIAPEKILAITFTRKAREEMQKRLTELGVTPYVETFNSFCEKILRKYGSYIYSRRTRIASYNDKFMAILAATKNIGMELPMVVNKYFNESQRKNKTEVELRNVFINDVFEVLDYFKLQGIKDFSDGLDGRDSENAKMIYKLVIYLREYMEIQGLRTYSDQIKDALTFLQENTSKIPKFTHILVDEFQDVNFSQIKIIDLLSPENLFCVGDPRQSIFGWRGSDINYILDFKGKYPNSEVINLKKNYRSNKNLVEFMNKSISKMNMVDLESNFHEEESIYLLPFENEEAESQFVLSSIVNLDVPREEIFILARTNRQLNDISRMMLSKGVPHILRNEFNEKEVESGKVTLSTIHSIKGLEAQAVFVIGCTSYNFPFKASDHPVMELVKMYDYDKEEEERRLFYVAVSRAKNKLYLTYVKNPTYFINADMKVLVKE